MRARENVALLEGVLGSMGSQLLGTTDAGAIREIAWVASDRICEVTPGLVVIKIVAGADGALGGARDQRRRGAGGAAG